MVQSKPPVHYRPVRYCPQHPPQHIYEIRYRDVCGHYYTEDNSKMQLLGVDRGLTLGRLTQNSSRTIVQNIVREQIKLIDGEITTAHHSGFNTVEHQLPSNFALNNMVKSDAQVMIYSELLYLLTTPEDEGGKGFEHVKINLSGNEATLIIRWVNGMDNEEMSERKKLIGQYTVKPKKNK